MKKLEGFTTLFLPSAFCVVLSVLTTQSFLKGDAFQGFWASLLQVVGLTAATYFIIRWRSAKETFEGKPDVHNEQKLYQASTFTYVATFISLGFNIWLVLS